MPGRRRPAAGRGGKKKAEAGEAKPKERKQRPKKEVEEDEMDYAEPETVVVTPEAQIQLTEKEQEEEVNRVLTWDDPNVPRNVTKYSYKELAYKLDPPGNNDHLAVHFCVEGCLLHRETDEAKMQEAAEQKKIEAEKERERRKKEAENSDAVDALVDDNTKNRFNYSERAAQTFNHPLRDRGVGTQPPPMAVTGGTLTQWDVYDTFMRKYEEQQREAEMTAKHAKGGHSKGGDGGTSGAAKSADDDVLHSAAVGQALKIVERMVNQNKEDEIYQDFKYWEDKSDEFREGEGSLLPLWRFSSDRSKRKQVTAVSWHPAFPDLFAVGFGSYDFMQQGSGLIYCYSLKNTSHPEFTFSTETGVMSLDFHPQHHALLCVGCYDGTVMVFDVRKKQNKPIYQSTIKTGKHTDPVWQVFWQEEDMAKELNFFSVSSDGRVANWLMTNTELKMEPVMQLKLVATSDEPEEETSLTGLAGGCCFDFNQFSEHLFVVGTEEGKVHKCSKAYSGQYLETYDGHHMAVYAARWNPFHPRIFLSCSADWTVKLWDHNMTKPVMTFDLGEAVGDVAWSPFSSSVFAAVTNDGKVHVYDLQVNKHEPLCEQKVVKRARLTHVAFNQRDPVLLVGDDRGGVISLKLSPNLRKTAEVPEDSTQQQVELGKMDALLASIDTRFD